MLGFLFAGLGHVNVIAKLVTALLKTAANLPALSTKMTELATLLNTFNSDDHAQAHSDTSPGSPLSLLDGFITGLKAWSTDAPTPPAPTVAPAPVTK